MLNDLSVEGQYGGVYDFERAIGRVMSLRDLTRSFGTEIFCHRNLLQTKVTSEMTMHGVVQKLDMNRRRAIMRWLTHHGPFWDDDRHHESNEYYECNQNVVTDTAVGEAAFCCLNGIDRGLISFSPSSWEWTPITVNHILDDQKRKAVDIFNFWDASDLEQFLEAHPAPVGSWDQLKNLAIARFGCIHIADNAFDRLKGHAFSRAAAERLLFIFNILNQFVQCFDEDGERTPEGHEMYRKFFTGKKGDGGGGPLFSDSSDQEKRDFERDMTFNHPENPDQTLFCTWHGKARTPPLRVHFTWPVRANETLYVVYVGPKITKR
jgi:hypothetical protein